MENKRKKRILLAFDSFKDTLRATEISKIVSDVLTEIFTENEVEIHIKNLSDGGEGFLTCFSQGIENFQIKTHQVTGPFPLSQVNAKYGIFTQEEIEPEEKIKKIGVIETAEIVGLELIKEKEKRNPLNTTTKGIGELLFYLQNIENCDEILIGCGGSATSDGGLGLLPPLGAEITFDNQFYHLLKNDFLLSSQSHDGLLFIDDNNENDDDNNNNNDNLNNNLNNKDNNIDNSINNNNIDNNNNNDNLNNINKDHINNLNNINDNNNNNNDNNEEKKEKRKIVKVGREGKIAISGRYLKNVKDVEGMGKLLEKCKVTIAVDVKNKFIGEKGAAKIFARQKGANEKEILKIEKAMIKWEKLLYEKSIHHFDEKRKCIKLGEIEGTGAAGGISGAFFLFFKSSNCVSGMKIILQTLNVDKEIEWADLIITGEGSFDRQSEDGKVIGCLRNICREKGKRLVVICGRSSWNEKLEKNGEKNVNEKEKNVNEKKGEYENEEDLLEVFDLVSRFGIDQSMNQTAICLRNLLFQIKDSLF